MSDSSQNCEQQDSCLRACLDAMDHCTMLTDYLTAVICYENYSACAENCDTERSEDVKGA